MHSPTTRGSIGRWSAPSTSPDRSSTGTPLRLADLVAALPMWSGRHEIVVTGDRPDLLAEVRRHWLPAAVVAWGQPDSGPLFEGRPADRAWRTCARHGRAGRLPPTSRRWPGSWRP